MNGRRLHYRFLILLMAGLLPQCSRYVEEKVNAEYDPVKEARRAEVQALANWMVLLNQSCRLAHTFLREPGATNIILTWNEQTGCWEVVNETVNGSLVMRLCLEDALGNRQKDFDEAAVRLLESTSLSNQGANVDYTAELIIEDLHGSAPYQAGGMSDFLWKQFQGQAEPFRLVWEKSGGSYFQTVLSIRLDGYEVALVANGSREAQGFYRDGYGTVTFTIDLNDASFTIVEG